MAATKFTADNRAAALDLFSDGLTNADVARGIGVSAPTLKGWITRGRKEPEGDYSDFAAAVEVARALAEEAELPLDEDELKLHVAKAARKGSVAAMKLAWEIIRASTDPKGEGSGDPLDALDGGEELEDEVAKQRAKTAAKA